MIKTGISLVLLLFLYLKLKSISQEPLGKTNYKANMLTKTGCEPVEITAGLTRPSLSSLHHDNCPDACRETVCLSVCVRSQQCGHWFITWLSNIIIKSRIFCHKSPTNESFWSHVSDFSKTAGHVWDMYLHIGIWYMLWKT